MIYASYVLFILYIFHPELFFTRYSAKNYLKKANIELYHTFKILDYETNDFLDYHTVFHLNISSEDTYRLIDTTTVLNNHYTIYNEMINEFERIKIQIHPLDNKLTFEEFID